MDISKEYIEMCEKAQEIQNHYNNKLYDYLKCGQEDGGDTKSYVFAWPNINQSICTLHLEDDLDWFFCKRSVGTKELVILPRQDQLQAICLEKYEEMKLLSKHYQLWLQFNVFTEQMWLNLTKDVCFDSFEKLWLLFVMLTLFKKQWDFSQLDWVSIS